MGLDVPCTLAFDLKFRCHGKRTPRVTGRRSPIASSSLKLQACKTRQKRRRTRKRDANQAPAPGGTPTSTPTIQNDVTKSTFRRNHGAILSDATRALEWNVEDHQEAPAESASQVRSHFVSMGHMAAAQCSCPFFYPNLLYTCARISHSNLCTNPCTTHVPNRHVRVHLYVGWKPGCDETEFVMRHSALVGDFPLDRSGCLSLARVNSKWALHGCAVSVFVCTGRCADIGWLSSFFSYSSLTSNPTSVLWCRLHISANRSVSSSQVRYGPSRIYITAGAQSAHGNRRGPQALWWVLFLHTISYHAIHSPLHLSSYVVAHHSFPHRTDTLRGYHRHA